MVAQLFHALLVFTNMNVAGWVLALVGGGLEFVGRYKELGQASPRCVVGSGSI